MDQQKLKLLIDSYGIDKMLEMSDVQPERALEVLIEEGLIDLTDFFYEDGEYND